MKQLDDAEQQRDEMIKISEEQRDAKIKAIQQMSDEELETMGWTREEAIRIAHLQHEQYVQEAEGLYQDAKAEYTKMAEDTTKITDQQREQTVKNAEEAKQGTVEAIDGLQKEIDEILNQSGDDYDDYASDVEDGTDKASGSTEGMKTRVVSALDETERNFITTGGVVSRQSANMQNDIDSIQGKTVDVVVKFKSINFQQVKQQVESAGSHVYSAGIPSYKDYLDGLPINFGTDYMNDLYGLKDAGIKTISLASLGMDTISAIAGKDGNSIVNNAVANYNYNNSQSVQEIGFKPIKIPQPQETERAIEVNINIDQMGIGTTKEEVKKLMKMIEQEIRIHGKKW